MNASTWSDYADALADDTFEDLTAASEPFKAFAPLPVWVAWRPPSKTPIDPKTGLPASSTNPATWGTLKQAQAQAGGVGIVLGKHAGLPATVLAGIDLDTCRTPSSGVLQPWADDILARLASYAEVSPSGTGVKIFFTIALPNLPALCAAIDGDTVGKTWKRAGGKHPPAIELHLGKRYYTVTHKQVPSAPAQLALVSCATLLEIITVQGPKFAAGSVSPDKPRKASDASRSGRALALAGKVRRAGGRRSDFDAALSADIELATWAEDTRQVDRTWAKAGDGLGDLDGFALNEDGVALAFARKFRDRLRYDHHAGHWFQWTGKRWAPDETKRAFAWARDTSRDMANAGLLDPGTKPLAKAATAAAVERFAQADRAFAVTSEIWDRDTWLLGTDGGVADLRTGLLIAARPDQFITKLTAVAPVQNFDADLDCPGWLSFLRIATGGDDALAGFLKRWCGYTLTGDTREHALLFIHGTGGNGKSVFLNTLTGILGDYCRTAGMEVFSKSHNDRHSQELARLKGARMVCASETEEGRAWAEVRIKQLTGGDTITARFMRQNDFEFRPEFKLTIIGNNKPILNNVDDAARRRFNVVPFEHRPETPDPELETKLRAEWPGILAWMIEGCLDWQANGLQRPESVLSATAEYFDAQDAFGRWLGECCEVGSGLTAPTSELFDSWCAFASISRHNALARSKGFPDAMKARGFVAIEKVKQYDGRRGRGFSGLRLLSQAMIAESKDEL